MKLYSSRKLYIYSDKCWTGSTKVYRQDEVDEQMVSYEFHAEAIANKDAEIAELVNMLEFSFEFVECIPGQDKDGQRIHREINEYLDALHERQRRDK